MDPFVTIVATWCVVAVAALVVAMRSTGRTARRIAWTVAVVVTASLPITCVWGLGHISVPALV